MRYFCQTIPLLQNYMNDYIPGRLNWSFCVGVCTEGAAAMTGRLSGLITRIKAVAFEFIIHNEMLVTRKLSTELNSVLQDVIEVIKSIKAHNINSRQFNLLCEEIDVENKRLLLFTEVR